MIAPNGTRLVKALRLRVSKLGIKDIVIIKVERVSSNVQSKSETFTCERSSLAS